MSELAPPSPCIAVCVLDPATGVCRGCLRTLPEIVAWPKLAAEEKRRVIAELPARRSRSGQAAAKL